MNDMQKKALIGDAILLTEVRRYLIVTYPRLPANDICHISDKIVCNANLVNWANLSLGFISNRGKIAANIFEAKLGKLYIEKKFTEITEEVVKLINYTLTRINYKCLV